MYTIQLHNLTFFSFHGLHEEEKIIGNTFEVSIDIFIGDIPSVKSIKDTLNYVEVYRVIKERMWIPTPLLENIAEDIVHSLQSLDKRIKEINISIKKKHPPITHFAGSVGITLKKTF